MSLQSVIAVAISRVNQFDAARLDVEMSAMLKEQLVKVFTLAKVYSIQFSSLSLFKSLDDVCLFGGD